jgi:DNA-directed RNA polymerase sigma subunit (sigma70/sigma32)
MTGLAFAPERFCNGDIVDPDVDVESEVISRLEAVRLWTNLRQLPRLERQVLIWSYGLNGVGELGLREIGKRLGSSKDSARRLRVRGLVHLRELYREEMEIPASGGPGPDRRLNGTGSA